ncbi:DUF1254 domain-containing protein [Demetria terragena]|uniref:DUF1254 domain-containing protein n=1 Tax=Demetria terragena TaxID=63959 RepID=UPI000382C716|nr:DUF1254 domain-containing protein [Demetria terragena]
MIEPTIDSVEAETLGTWAYVYGYPVVKNLIVRSEATDPTFERYAPPNAFHHHREGARPAFTDMTPNVDTPYSLAWVDVSTEPVVLSLPALPERYHVFQFTDFYIETFANPGTRETAGVGGDYVICPPGWDGKLPAGTTRIDAPTVSCWLQGRTLFDGDDDLAELHRAQDQYRLTPLSIFVGERPATDDSTPTPEPRVPAEVVDSLAFFAALNRGMTQNPPPARDDGLFALFARINVGPGRDFAPDSLASDVADGLRRGIETGKDLIARQAREVRLVNNWEVPTSGVGTYGTDFLQRARVAKYGYAGNVPQETVYANTLVDTGGVPLDGTGSYRMQFEAGQLPPVQAFWSLTMYAWPQARLVDNPINRYAIGDRTRSLQYGQDGSLEIVLSHEQPATGASNWLPAPAGPFWLIMRLYLPDARVHDGDYQLPGVERVASPT